MLRANQTPSLGIDARGVLTGTQASEHLTYEADGHPLHTPRHIVIFYSIYLDSDGDQANKVRAVNPEWHVVISRTGLITQILPFNRQCYEPLYTKINQDGLIKILLINAGPLSHWNGKLESKYGQTVNKQEVVFEPYTNQMWHAYSVPQLVLALNIMSLLHSKYNIGLVGAASALGYDTVAPGPAFITGLENLGKPNAYT